MRLCIGTAKGIVILDPARGSAPMMVVAVPSSVWCMAQDCDDPDLLYAGSVHNTQMGNARGKGSLARSNDGGRTWHDVTPGHLRDADVWAVATPPDSPGEVFIGTSHARILRSKDGGRSFSECTAFLKLPGRDRWTFPPAPHVPHVRSIAFDRHHPGTLYAGVEEGGIFRSRDHGQSFEPLNQSVDADIHSVVVDPDDPDRLYATTGRGFYFSANAGMSWHFVKGLNRGYAVPLMVRAGAGKPIYFAAAAGPPPLWSMGALGADALIFRSLDRGESFQPLAAEDGAINPMRGMVMRLLPALGESPEFFAALSNGSLIRLDDHAGHIATVTENLPPVYDFVALA